EKLFIEDAKKYVQVKEFIKNELKDALCGDIEIQDTPLGTRVVIYTLTPGIIIGAGGERIKKLTKVLENDFGFKNPQIDIKKIDKPFLDPSIVARYIASALERGAHFKKIANYYLSRVMQAGATGCEIVISGKLGSEKSRTERFSAGYVEKSGQHENVLKAYRIAETKPGVIGIRVYIMIKPKEEFKKLKEIVSKEIDMNLEENKEGDFNEASKENGS
ncbi:MAG: 30S ribosomal protein S3, partial [Candidatus Aenigmarchaeota archaeon]|nr:30S ribosomal protein S3 [Candidatus Aenigmarchaeota archaeon]